MLKYKKEEAERIKRGDTDLLKKLLQDLDLSITKSLKNNKDDVRFYQGAALVTDTLIKILCD